ncbi:hypothetical protein H6761_03970 [Candidatus Nomurabacteria bacterium]|nr:hypothetical protein [Candidatus Nomurabacteria bacterium]
MNLTKLFDWHYLVAPYALNGFSWPIRITLLILFLGSIFIALLSINKIKNIHGPKSTWKKLQLWGFSVGPIGLLLMFFREVRAVYLGSRIWLLLWIIIALIWLGFIIYYWKIKLPLKIQTQKEKEEFEKWLPKAKK